MNKEKIYRPPVTTIVFMQEEPVMALSAKTGKHTLDEGMETEDGWTDCAFEK